MKAQLLPIQNFKACTCAIFILFTMLLTACAPSASTPAVTPLPANPDEGNHAPVILKVIERTETKDGKMVIYENITFVDADGDATTIVDRGIWSNQRVTTSNVEIAISPEDQKEGATVTDTWGCGPDLLRVVETRILDKAGHLSEPVRITIACPRSQLPNILPFLIAALVIALGVLCGAWLFLRKRPSERASLFQSLLYLFFLILPLSLMYVVLHEGGHALVSLAHGGKVELFYVHPFSFTSYNMPPFDWNNVLFHAGGALLVLPVSLVISALFWKRRSVSSLFLAMAFPWLATQQALRILTVSGDFSTIIFLTGLPIPLFIVTGILLVGIGMFLVASLLPLLGLMPGDRKSLFVIPVALFLWATLGITVAYFLVPGTPVDLQYRTTAEIFSSSILNLIFSPIIGLILAVSYVTLFRKQYPRLPAWLHNETVHLTWKDLRIPGILGAVSIVIGLIFIL